MGRGACAGEARPLLRREDGRRGSCPSLLGEAGGAGGVEGRDATADGAPVASVSACTDVVVEDSSSCDPGDVADGAGQAVLDGLLADVAAAEDGVEDKDSAEDIAAGDFLAAVAPVMAVADVVTDDPATDPPRTSGTHPWESGTNERRRPATTCGPPRAPSSRRCGGSGGGSAPRWEERGEDARVWVLLRLPSEK